MQFRVIVVTVPQTNKHTQTGPITIHCAACSVIIIVIDLLTMLSNEVL